PARLADAGRLRNEGHSLRDAGRFVEAAAAYAAAAEAFGGLLPEDDPVRIDLLDAEGVMRLRGGELDRARGVLGSALAARERHFGPDHPEVGYALVNLAALHLDLGDAATAAALLEWALPLLGGDAAVSLRTTALGHLATAHQLEGDFVTARRLFEEAVAALEGAGDGYAVDLARALNNLADLLMDQGDVDAAAPLYERSLALRETALGPDHPDVARAVNNYGSVLH